MTLTIDLSANESARLDRAARQQGINAAELARQLLARHLPPLNTNPASEEAPGDAGEREQARLAAIQAARGSLANVNASVDGLHRERQRDREKEEALAGTEAR